MTFASHKEQMESFGLKQEGSEDGAGGIRNADSIYWGEILVPAQFSIKINQSNGWVMIVENCKGPVTKKIAVLRTDSKVGKEYRPSLQELCLVALSISTDSKIVLIGDNCAVLIEPAGSTNLVSPQTVQPKTLIEYKKTHTFFYVAMMT